VPVIKPQEYDVMMMMIMMIIIIIIIIIIETLSLY